MHKLQEKPGGWTTSGMIEPRRLLEKLEHMVGVDKYKNNKIKKIYRSRPHVTIDNYFSGDKNCDW